MDALLQDLRYALRILRLSPGFSAVVVLTLALGIGANTALFSLGSAMLGRAPAGVHDSHRLLWVSGLEDGHHTPLSYPDFRRFQAGTRSFEGVAAFFDADVSFASATSSDRVRAELVTGDYFHVLRAPVALGRALTPADDRPGAPLVVVIGHETWRRRFGSDPAVLGAKVSVNGAPATVVGVAARGFNGGDHDLRRELWLPLVPSAARALPQQADLLEEPSSWWLSAIGRLRPGATVRAADAELEVAAAGIRRDDPQGHGRFGARTYSAAAGIHPADAETVLGLGAAAFAVTGLVLLIACANVSSLLLGRAVARRREIAVRLSLGAARRRLVRQLLTESLLLAALATGGGLLLSTWAIRLLLAAVPFPPLDASPDARVLAFCVAAAAAVAVLFGLVPALHATRTDVADGLREGAGSPDRRRSRLQGRFVTAQVALSTVLLAAAGLLLHSLSAERASDPGFDASPRVLALSFDLGLQGYGDARAAAFVDALAERAAALPGVRSVSFADHPPFSRQVGAEAVAEGAAPREHGAEVTMANVSPGYFRTLAMPLLQGRDFTAQDGPGAPAVAVVDAALARTLWPGKSPLGMRLSLGGREGPYATVVGIARPARTTSVYDRAHPGVYLAQRQHPSAGGLTLLVRTEGDAARLAGALRRQVKALDADLPLYGVRTMEQSRREASAPMRIASTLASGFGLLALLLAGTGIYAVMAFAVSQRTREIGLRVALGARAAAVAGLVVRQGMRLVLAGGGIGLVLALAVGKVLGSMLYGVGAVDPLALGGVAALLGAVACAAAYLPARRAAAVDPMAALRAD
jgi:predicted permease